MANSVTNIDGRAVLIVIHILTVIAIAFVGMRVYARYFIQHLFTLSDLLTCISLVFLLGTNVMHDLMYAWGFWDYTVDFSPDAILNTYGDNPHLKKLLMMTYAQIIIGGTGLWCNKASLLLLYYSLIPVEETTLMRCLHALTIYVALAYCWMIPINLFWCQPINSNWTTYNTCFNLFSPVPLYTSYFLNCTTQIGLMLLPLFLLRKLYYSKTSPLSHRQIIASGITFSLIGVSIIAMSANFALLVGLATDSVVALCGDLEQSITIMLVCVPSMRFLFMRKLEHVREVYRDHVRHKEEAKEREEELTDLAADDNMLAPPPRRPVLFALHDDGTNISGYTERRKSTLAAIKKKSIAQTKAQAAAAQSKPDPTAGTGFRPLDPETGEGGLFAVGSGSSTPDSTRRSREDSRSEVAPAEASSSRRRSSPKATMASQEGSEVVDAAARPVLRERPAAED